jgi:hypothetical protein
VNLQRSEVRHLLLLFKQIIKRRPRIAWPRARRSRSQLLSRRTNLIKRAIISRILFRYALLHRLHALKPTPRIEIHALLARVEFKSALWTPPIRCHPLQHGPALCTPRDRMCSGQIDGPRPKCIIAFWWWSAGSFSRTFALFSIAIIAIAILISMLTVFRHRSSPKQLARIVYPIPSARQVGVKLRLPHPSRAILREVGIFFMGHPISRRSVREKAYPERSRKVGGFHETLQ